MYATTRSTIKATLDAITEAEPGKFLVSIKLLTFFVSVKLSISNIASSMKYSFLHLSLFRSAL